jgi:N-acetylneuraminate synthase
MSMSIAGRSVGPGYKPLVIAELGINHEGSLELAKIMARAAIESGAEVIKHQTHVPNAEMSEEAKAIIPGNTDVSIFEVISRCALTFDEEEQLAEFVRSLGAIYMSTPFSFEAADFLDDLKVPAFKVGSGECNNYPLIEHVASKGKPMIVSTGMNSIETISPTVEIMRNFGIPFALLHCTNLYPTPSSLIRVEAIKEIKNAFPDAIMGLSDHSLTNHPSFAAVALGACILERHFTDSKLRPGPDIVCSMTPEELKDLIRGSEIIHDAMHGEKYPLVQEDVTIAFAFASVVATRDLRQGEIISRKDITMKRPNGGDFGPKDFKRLIGAEVVSDIRGNLQIRKDQIRIR